MLRHSVRTATLPSAATLLKWYDSHARTLPWRAPPGAIKKTDPYRVWLSEVMLQQTTVPAVIPYFHKFLTLWPKVSDLAAAPIEDVLTAWAGLGYYARARNLHKCAVAITTDHGGKFPKTLDGLSSLPGIGGYTSAAIAAIAFDVPATVVDGNVERVMARIFALEDPLPEVKPLMKQKAAALTPATRPGDYAQAVMDLGATICTPRKPKCLLCPWVKSCAAHARGIAEELPRKAAEKEKPVRQGIAFWLEAPHPDSGEPAVFLIRRPPQGLLGGMTAFPSVGWDGNENEALLSELDWDHVGQARHTFTHFHLDLSVMAIRLAKPRKRGLPEGMWWPIKNLGDSGLPTAMKKAMKLGVGWSDRE